MSEIKFKMAARCEAAGRPNNEDNFQLTDNLANDQWSFMTDSEVVLSEKGALLIVCDGMGGMNAGEVASKLAVDAIKEWFAADRLTIEITASSSSIVKYIEKAIIAADSQIKKEGKKDREKEGMGSTVVLAWIIGQSVFIGWCGDSRAYCFNPANGLKQLSHDHSYVQDLVDSGKLSEELAFDHPDGNIITRSLGDPRRAAKPEAREYPLHDGDIIMLCSDGLCGVLRDREIETVMNENPDSMEACRDALWNAARNAGWHDNVTIGLCRITQDSEQEKLLQPDSVPRQRIPAKKRILTFIIGMIVGIAVLFAIKFVKERFPGKNNNSVGEEKNTYGQEYTFPSVSLNDSATIQYISPKKDTLFIQVLKHNGKEKHLELIAPPELKKDTLTITLKQ